VDMAKNRKNSWLDKISNEEVLVKVVEDRQIKKIIQQRQHHWIRHILWHQNLLLEITERSMEGRSKGGRRRMSFWGFPYSLVGELWAPKVGENLPRNPLSRR